MEKLQAALCRRDDPLNRYNIGSNQPVWLRRNALLSELMAATEMEEGLVSYCASIYTL